MRQSEQHALSRLESTRKQHERDLRQLMEEHTREMERQRSEAETAARETVRERERTKEEHEDKKRQLLRAHQVGQCECSKSLWSYSPQIYNNHRMIIFLIPKICLGVILICIVIVQSPMVC